MFLHPEIAAKIADQRQRDLIGEADAYRLSHAARAARPAGPHTAKAAGRVTSHLAAFVGGYSVPRPRPSRPRWARLGGTRRMTLLLILFAIALTGTALTACSARPDSRPSQKLPPGRTTAATNPATAAGGSEAAGTPVTPRQALLAAATEANNIKSATETVTVQDSGVQNVSTTGTIQLRRAPAMVIAEDLTVTAAGKNTQIKAIVTGTAVYLHEASLASQIGKPWIRLDLSALHTPGLAAFAQLVRSAQSNNFLNQTQLIAAASDVRDVGRQAVDGVPTTEYAGSFQSAELAKVLAPALRKVLAPVLQALGKSTVNFHVWVDGQHHPRKETEVETVNGLSISTAVTIRLINQPVQITLPPASQTFTPPGS